MNLLRKELFFQNVQKKNIFRTKEKLCFRKDFLIKRFWTILCFLLISIAQINKKQFLFDIFVVIFRRGIFQRRSFDLRYWPPLFVVVRSISSILRSMICSTLTLISGRNFSSDDDLLNTKEKRKFLFDSSSKKKIISFTIGRIEFVFVNCPWTRLTGVQLCELFLDSIDQWLRYVPKTSEIAIERCRFTVGRQCLRLNRSN